MTLSTGICISARTKTNRLFNFFFCLCSFVQDNIPLPYLVSYPYLFIFFYSTNFSIFLRTNQTYPFRSLFYDGSRIIYFVKCITMLIFFVYFFAEWDMASQGVLSKGILPREPVSGGDLEYKIPSSTI